MPRSKRLDFRPLATKDIDVFHALCLDEGLRRFLLDGQEMPRAWAATEVAESERRIADGGLGLYLAVSFEGRPVGFAGFRAFAGLGPEPQLLYAFTGEHHGEGYGLETAQLMTHLAFEEGAGRVVAAVDAPNLASIWILEQAGFAPAGVVPGGFGDTILFERYASVPPPRLPLAHGQRVELPVAVTWSGETLGDDERTSIALTSLEQELRVEIDAPYHGDPAPEAAPGPTDHLWDHEVVELFLLGQGERYLEIELGPHGHHLLLLLEGRRRVVGAGFDIHYDARIEGDRWKATARIPRLWIPEGVEALNGYAIHGLHDARRYLCWRPTGGDAPDFHHLEAFGRAADL